MLPTVESIRDLGIIVYANLDFDEHIVSLVKATRSLVNSLFRCFIVKDPEFYIRLYRALVVTKHILCTCLATV